jgi:hypothetical protein
MNIWFAQKKAIALGYVCYDPRKDGLDWRRYGSMIRRNPGAFNGIGILVE